MNRRSRIQALQESRDAVVVAHYYQHPEVKEVAHFVGDSLAMARFASNSAASTLVIAGVRFMAETVAVLNPDKRVILPESLASCSLADQCDPRSFKDFVDAHPKHVVVTYINSPIEVKAMSDFVCTSSNAVDVIRSIPRDQEILFAPDRHLGEWLQQQTERAMVIWDGECEVHAEFSLAKIKDLQRAYPQAQVLAHPECDSTVAGIATVVGSTSRLLAEVQRHPTGTFIIATEEGILFDLRRVAPMAHLIAAPLHTPNECACGECPHMKRTTIASIERALVTLEETIEIPVDLRRKAAGVLTRSF